VSSRNPDFFSRLEWYLVKSLILLLAVIGALKLLRIEMAGLF
jgi:hypothetical protein